MKLSVLAILFTTKFVPLVLAILGFGLLVAVHEFGHFLFCKIFGIDTPTFSIGMGPTLFRRQIGKTNFRIALIPIGGYVEIAGISEIGQGEQKQAREEGPNTFGSKPYWQKFLVLTGGILFNIMFAYAAFSSLYMVGLPVVKEVELFVEKAIACEDGIVNELSVGDKLVAIDGYKLPKEPDKLFPLLRIIGQKALQSKSELVKIGVERDGKMVYIDVLSEANGTKLVRGLIAGAQLERRPVLVEYEQYPFFTAIGKGIAKTHEWIGKVFSSLKMLFTKRNIKDFGGPIMIVSYSFKMAQRGLLWLFVFLAIISINLAVINILPIGALDGGQLLFETIEAIIRRKIPYMIRMGVNLVSWLLILSLILFLSYQDISKAIFGRCR